LTGRAGESFGNLLVYSKGGATWANENHAAQGTLDPVNIFSGSTFRWGWTAGLGLEYAFTPAWSGRVEYDYLSFGNTAISLNNASGNQSNVGLSQNLSVVKMGFNYKIGADLTAGANVSAAVPTWVKAPVFKVAPPSDWTIETGARYWVSSGRKQQDLNGSVGFTPTLIISRLFYEGVIGQTAESFARLDHRNGIFIKGNFGLGDLAKGKFYDEDFPPGTAPYANTLSSQRDGRTIYGGIDIGHALITGPNGDLGAYVGYRNFYERENAFGIYQLPHVSPTTSTSVLSITFAEAWSGLAVGLNTRVPLADRWRLELDAAFLPDVRVWGVDNHWLRPDFNPGPEQGFGWGTQFEGILTYALTDQWSIGAGGRYWFFTSPTSHFQAQNAVTPQPLLLYTQRYGGFLQASYKFGGASTISASKSAADKTGPASWTGIYMGANVGAGLGRTNWSDPFGPTPSGDQDFMGGALAGGQIGANYQIGALVYGLAAAGSWAEILGTNTCFAGNPNQGIAGQNCATTLGALADITGRVGYAAERTLYYVKAGPSWGRSTFRLDFLGAETAAATNPSSSLSSVGRWGWTIGGGIEHSLTNKWSIVGEYRYVDLGSATVRFTEVPTAIALVATEIINQRYQVLTLGINYKLFDD
jgi:opacity protein-like surface antigen